MEAISVDFAELLSTIALGPSLNKQTILKYRGFCVSLVELLLCYAQCNHMAAGNELVINFQDSTSASERPNCCTSAHDIITLKRALQ